MPRIIIKIVLIGVFFRMLPGCAVNPVTGEQQLMLISAQQDIQIGKKYAPEIEKQMGGKIADVPLQNEEKIGPLQFFSSHPSPQNRVKYLTNIIRVYLLYEYIDGKELSIAR